MKHNKQAWTIAVTLLLVMAAGFVLGGWQINNGGGGSSGVPIAGTLNLAAQTADVSTGAGTIIASVTTGGIYRVSCYTVVTTRDPVSSTLPKCIANFTDNDTNTAENSASQQLTNTSTGNGVGNTGLQCAFCAGSTTISAKAGTAIIVVTSGYASNTAATMQFSLHARVEGPF